MHIPCAEDCNIKSATVFGRIQLISAEAAEERYHHQHDNVMEVKQSKETESWL